MTYVIDLNPITRAAKQYKEKTTNLTITEKEKITTKLTTTENNITTITKTKDTKLVNHPIKNKSNRN
jgi:hypothetical protein